MKFSLTKKILVVTVIFGLLPLASQANGWESGFDPNNLMSDSYLAETGTMNVKDIQHFLETQPGVLKNYRSDYIDGRKLSAAEIFSEAANKFDMNPRALIALVEKEQRLLTDPNPSDKALNWATGFGPYGHTRYCGFGHQVYYAAKVVSPGGDYDTYQDHYKSFQVGKETSTLDGYRVKPVNRTTCKWYIYNPLVGSPKARFGANWLLWHLLNVRYKDSFARYQGNGQVAGANKNSASRFFYRDGTPVMTEGVIGVSVIKNGKRYGLEGRQALLTRYHPSEIVTIPRSEFDTYPYAGKIGLPDGIAVQRAKGGAVYIVSDGQLRGVPNLETLQKLGYSPANVIKISDAEANFHPVGPKVSAKKVPRLNGQLVQVAGESGVYQFRDNKLYPIWSSQIKNLGFEHVPVALVSKKEAKKYKEVESSPVPARDGSLLMTTEGPQAGAVFVISGGHRYGFKSREVFDEAGYDFSNVVTVSRPVLEIHPPGRDIEIY